MSKVLMRLVHAIPRQCKRCRKVKIIEGYGFCARCFILEGHERVASVLGLPSVQCSQCGSVLNVEAHDLKDRNLRGYYHQKEVYENPQDFTLLCRSCHHTKRSRATKSGFPPLRKMLSDRPNECPYCHAKGHMISDSNRWKCKKCKRTIRKTAYAKMVKGLSKYAKIS